MKEMWNKRYSEEGYAYGIEPNEFLKQSLKKLNLSGTILFPCEGEGRNVVFAAQNGLETYAFDLSEEGQKKSLALANEKNVTINYEVCEFENLTLPEDKFDHACFIYAHFPAKKRYEYHRKIADLVKKDGYIILEGFSKKNLPYREKNPKVGGPPQLNMLFDTNQIKEDFYDFETIYLQEKVISLNEGKYHVGEGSVIRFIGKKT